MSVLTKIISKTSRKARYLRGDIAHLTGFDKNYYERARGSRILAYHGVCQTEPLKFNTLFITQKNFETHLQFYTRYFNMVSVDDFYQQCFSADKFNLCLTFDDGFANSYNYVLPLLEKYRVPATFFVPAVSASGYNILWNDILSIAGKYGPESIIFKGKPYQKAANRQYCNADGLSLNVELRQTGFAEKAELIGLLDKLCPFRGHHQYQDYWLQMSAVQIKQASESPFVTIGAHGYYHNDLAGIPPADAAIEMGQSKQYLECLINKPINSTAFPYGSYDYSVLTAAKTCGYTQLLATDFNTPADSAEPAMRERFTINPFLSPTNQMHANISGTY